ncbi:hypothetical protein CEXT_293701 [Caerostris extrusa]|uniref:Uncharacterized protein n=1 Tax=Caerostris extrusa TaxID=172846 RepID=A0AAV4UVL4_CAEEX|nr:hypothetical protein CEXT_293701 [Caerostris extrusa]
MGHADRETSHAIWLLTLNAYSINVFGGIFSPPFSNFHINELFDGADVGALMQNSATPSRDCGLLIHNAQGLFNGNQLNLTPRHLNICIVKWET